MATVSKPAIVRIECKAERMNVAPDAGDTRVFIRRIDGTEVEIPGVQKVAWSVACDGCASVATLYLTGVEIDAEGVLVELGLPDELMEAVTRKRSER